MSLNTFTIALVSFLKIGLDLLFFNTLNHEYLASINQHLFGSLFYPLTVCQYYKMLIECRILGTLIVVSRNDLRKLFVKFAKASKLEKQ